ncbi:hypothetical protein [Celeribacter sp.]|uniref:hypothetical protein n=1 Tax=Celeribacter sp. TaxID=1890673 RepID=UPI003A9286A8
MDRRLFLLGALGLGACQATTEALDDSQLTTAFDGDYSILVARTWNPTPENVRDPHYQTGPETLALISARVTNGAFSLLRVDDSAGGSNYQVFDGFFAADGTLILTMTVGYMIGKPKSYRMKIRSNVGRDLLSGQAIILRPQGFDANYQAHVTIRKLS